MKGSEAERLVESWLQMNGWTTHRAAATGFHRYEKKGGGHGFAVKSHDLFGCIDILAFRRSLARDEDETWAIQVTTQGGRSARRRKIEPVDWPYSWRISLVSHESTPDPANRARKLHFIKAEDFEPVGWLPAEAFQIDPKAIEAFRKARAAEKAKA